MNRKEIHKAPPIIRHPVSGIRNPASGIRNPASGIPILIAVSCLLASGIWHPAPAQNTSLAPGSLAWAGGMNSVQFCELDLNRDGVRDLLAFDRHGNRIIPLVYMGTSGSSLYQPDTSYISRLPDLHDWVMTADYNCDGLMDIFTYGLGGIRVFNNISGNTLQFKLVTEMLTSWFYTGQVGILVTPVDYPALSDIDGDGDLDLLTFFGLGSYVEYHKNLSIEKYGNCDSLDFRMEDNCWGKFKESEGSNKITLNADCPSAMSDSRYAMRDSRYAIRDARYAMHDTLSGFRHPASDIGFPASGIRHLEPKHTGSTLLAIDLNGNGLKDLILGDVDFPNLISLFNGGTQDSAFMTGFDTLFPQGSVPVNLFDFPVPSNVDVNHDGLKDLLISSFDPQLRIPDNYQSVWLYRNTGSAYFPKYTFQSKRLFQDQMIDVGSGSYPLFADLDRDGLTDLLVGSWGKYDSSYYQDGLLKTVNTARIAFFRNTGTLNIPVFTLITEDLANLSSLRLTGIFPACGDLNGDGYPDLVTGQDDGTLIYLENDATGSFPPAFSAPVMKYKGIDVGEGSTPQLFDLGDDGLADLIIGEKNGNLNYYRNTGSAANPEFSLTTDSLGHVNVTNYQVSYTGYSTPCFVRDREGSTRLLVGSEEGKVWYFDEIPSDPTAIYPESSDLYTLISAQRFPIRCGWRTAPAIGCLSDSTWSDLTVGNWSGGLNYFTRFNPPQVLLAAGSTPQPEKIRFNIFPNPAGNYLSVSIPPTERTESLNLKIINLFGQEVMSVNVNPLNHSEEHLDIHHLTPGFYLVTLTDPTGNSAFSSRKLVISQ